MFYGDSMKIEQVKNMYMKVWAIFHPKLLGKD